MRRVVVTGFGGLTALGDNWPTIRAAFEQGRTATRVMTEWQRFTGINTRLGAPIPDRDARYPETDLPRKAVRTMGPVARMALLATRNALTDAGLVDDPVLKSGRTGIAYGSSFGSTNAVVGFAELLTEGNSKAINGTTYIRMMSHTAAVNIGLFFGLTGRIIPTSTACTSGSQAIVYACEAIRYGLQDVMIAGGAEEHCVTMAAVFDTLYATSVRNDTPHLSPRPFDCDRDGLVIGEGAAALILEERERALARGATIHAEVVGVASNSDGEHVTQPREETVRRVMEHALADAGLPAAAIGYINGHGTATDWGDVVESRATAAVFGAQTPFHSLKGHFGHSLGACGAIEAWLGIAMMKEGWLVPTANLATVDPRCGELDYIIGEPRRCAVEHFISNNMAFGGINTSLILRRP